MTPQPRHVVVEGLERRCPGGSSGQSASTSRSAPTHASRLEREQREQRPPPAARARRPACRRTRSGQWPEHVHAQRRGGPVGAHRRLLARGSYGRLCPSTGRRPSPPVGGSAKRLGARPSAANRSRPTAADQARGLRRLAEQAPRPCGPAASPSSGSRTASSSVGAGRAERPSVEDAERPRRAPASTGRLLVRPRAAAGGAHVPRATRQVDPGTDRPVVGVPGEAVRAERDHGVRAHLVDAAPASRRDGASGIEGRRSHRRGRSSQRCSSTPSRARAASSSLGPERGQRGPLVRLGVGIRGLAAGRGHADDPVTGVAERGEQPAGEVGLVVGVGPHGRATVPSSARSRIAYGAGAGVVMVIGSVPVRCHRPVTGAAGRPATAA